MSKETGFYRHLFYYDKITVWQDFTIDLRKLKSLIEIFEKSQVSEMEISEGEEKIRLVRESAKNFAGADHFAKAVETGFSSVVRPEGAAHSSLPGQDKPPPEPESAQEQYMADMQKPLDGGLAKRAAAPSRPGIRPDENMEVSEIISPMVGTFYAASAPDKEPYVTVGSVVQEGDVLCLIEAMKLMNEIKSTVTGKVVSIKVSNAEAVGYGDILMVIGVR